MIMKKQLLLLVMILLPMVASADAVEIDGIYYELITKIKEAKVVQHPQKYKNNIVIPDFVSYNGIDYNVSSIDHGAFGGCYNLTSVNIPSSVNSIGDYAFYGCFRLSSIVIPSSVISIGREAFLSCRGLTSITIPKSVTSIGDYAFERCSCLESIIVESGNLNYDSRDECNAIIEKSSNRLICGCMNTIIPSSVEIIGVLAFVDCTSLKTINIPSGVKTIESNAFDGCTGLSSLNLNNGLISIGGAAFRGCESLSSITIPNSVRTIIDYAFTSCSNITTIIIGKDIEKIGSGAFANCKELTDVYCNAQNVPENICLSLNSSNYGKLCTDAFEGSLIEYATLHVPSSSVNAYKAAEPWKSFKSIVSIESGETPETQKCEKPTISYVNGQLQMSCATEGVEYVTEITDADVKKHYDATISLSATYNISVYATKALYENSETATATLCWIDATPKTEGIVNGVAQIAARPILVKTDNGFITVEGVEDRTNVSVYTTDGKQVGSAISQNNAATIATSLQPDSIAIVKVGEKSVKVVMK